MNREIKFRAWDVKFKQWTTCGMGYGKENDMPIMQVEATADHEIILMQFTGLLDKNGKEIYEGDIIQFDFGAESKQGVVNTLVTFEDGFFGYNVYKSKQVTRGKEWDEAHEFIKSRWWGSSRNSYPLTDGFYGYGKLERTEIIGNIYENPELINQSQLQS